MSLKIVWAVLDDVIANIPGVFDMHCLFSSPSTCLEGKNKLINIQNVLTWNFFSWRVLCFSKIPTGERS